MFRKVPRSLVLAFVVLVSTASVATAGWPRDVERPPVDKNDPGASPWQKEAAGDPSGDTFNSGAVDLTGLTAVLGPSGLVITVDFDTDLDATAGDVIGFIDMDTDRDATTGDLPWSDAVRPDGVGGSTGMGNECYVDLFTYDSSDGAVDLVDDVTETLVGRVPASFTAGSFTVSIPKDLLFGSDGIAVAAILGDLDGPTDVAPNDGSVAALEEPAIVLQNGRFEIVVEWLGHDGATGFGRDAVSTVDSAVVYFFSETNWEMLIKVLEACTQNDRWWVFFSGSTDVQFEVRVTDTQTGAVQTYMNPLGNPAHAITDTDAFACP